MKGALDQMGLQWGWRLLPGKAQRVNVVPPAGPTASVATKQWCPREPEAAETRPPMGAAACLSDRP